MIDIPVYNKKGEEVDRMQVDEAALGGRVRPILLKQAIVMYHANKRQGTVATKSRGMVAGSTRKLYRQKGTGRARAGTIRTVVRKGGGVAFAKVQRDFRQRMPQKQRRLARDSAVLVKLKSGTVVVVDKLEFSEPKTREFVTVLGNLNIDRSCLVAVDQSDVNVYKSMRNIPKVDMLEIDQLNAGDICSKQKLLFTRRALEILLEQGSSSSIAGKE